MGWKYIMLEIKEGYRFPIIFPDKLVHKDVANALKLHCPSNDWAVPTSAGTIYSLDVKGVGGSSETLKIESLGKYDEDMINTYNYTHGII
jgi:hypothetical protein